MKTVLKSLKITTVPIEIHQILTILQGNFYFTHIFNKHELNVYKFVMSKERLAKCLMLSFVFLTFLSRTIVTVVCPEGLILTVKMVYLKISI